LRGFGGLKALDDLFRKFNYTLKKLIELSLAVGKAPVIVFKPLAEIISSEREKITSSEILPIDKVAEPNESYQSE